MSLRADIVKLAHEKPELRKHLLPLLGHTAAEETEFEVSGQATFHWGWSVRVKAESKAQAEKKGLDIIDRPGGKNVEWYLLNGSGKVEPPTKKQLNEMTEYEVAHSEEVK